MQPSTPCEAWRELLYGANRGAIYQYFLDNKTSLVDHLKTCETCNLQASSVVEEDMFDMIYIFNSMSPAEFAQLIREMYRRAQDNTWDYDTQP
ncbi:MAG: hypothetical protein A2534_04090 [Candidatus Magasanikbacteria bacterium RIFOXYD2_FULL_39_9]|uniref:Uncharacterized protein n=1 Tax=Candidatus Magasanikbacteria bacterium RIFOXYD1_FULL_40_23 TaxID=1798705 RepID=A0A1F6P9Q5_9BACT|nr:MAG: hypothetical protein A2534_04090 [Candidatus Magasanikbacteria bacterium RIFOXYD2_FULL_39_9]OGH92896.1 MAG: hypothetical protein A2563_04495 [Candidatus Magasanikbacteria bacterium RIFOXYD1_FULL_40_23]